MIIFDSHITHGQNFQVMRSPLIPLSQRLRLQTALNTQIYDESTENPPTRCYNLLFMRGSQSVESCIEAKAFFSTNEIERCIMGRQRSSAIQCSSCRNRSTVWIKNAITHSFQWYHIMLIQTKEAPTKFLHFQSYHAEFLVVHIRENKWTGRYRALKVLFFIFIFFTTASLWEKGVRIHRASQLLLFAVLAGKGGPTQYLAGSHAWSVHVCMCIHVQYLVGEASTGM